MKFTVGSDVEFFVYNPEGKLVPSQGLLGDDEHGTKHNPLKFDGFTLQRDNVAIEFATPICRNKREFVSAIRDGIKLIMRTIPAGYTIKAVPSVVFTPDQLEHPEAMEFGCDPDFNAWKKGRVNPKPFSLNSGLRTGGLHIHVGHPSLGEKDAKIRMIQYMDLLLGNLSILLDRSPASAVRKELYGKSGAYRPTPYGCEYRTLSNFWASHPKLVELAYDLTERALMFTNLYPHSKHRNPEKGINENNPLLAVNSFNGWMYACAARWIKRAASIKLTTFEKDWRI
jgi:hypothetical protein